jgi:hypothetical protein
MRGDPDGFKGGRFRIYAANWGNRIRGLERLIHSCGQDGLDYGTAGALQALKAVAIGRGAGQFLGLLGLP